MRETTTTTTTLYYTILYYTILYYTILYYTILYYTILYYTILFYIILHCTIHEYVGILYCTVLYYTNTIIVEATNTLEYHAWRNGRGEEKTGPACETPRNRVTEYCTAFGIDPKCWMRAAQDEPEWYRKVETGAEVFMSARSTKGVNETNTRHAKELFATLPFELP